MIQFFVGPPLLEHGLVATAGSGPSPCSFRALWWKMVRDSPKDRNTRWLCIQMVSRGLWCQLLYCIRKDGSCLRLESTCALETDLRLSMLTNHHAHRSSTMYLAIQLLIVAKCFIEQYCDDCDTFWTKGRVQRVSTSDAILAII